MLDPPFRWKLFAAIVAGPLALACGAEPPKAFAPEPYLADLAQLESFTATTYANLEWALREGGVDPVATHEEARRAILEAADEAAAVAALRGFVERFGDGHFRLLPERAAGTGEAGDGPPPPGPETPPGEACAALGYEEHDQSFRLDFGDGFQATTAPDDPFPAGWIELGGRRVGIVRIDEFGANRFGEYCPESWQSYRQGLSGPCDDWPCEYGFRLAVVDRLLDEIGGRIADLEELAITALAVDITGNGGGSDWVYPTAGMLTAKPLVGAGRSVVRHPHWVGVFGEMLADVDRDLVRTDLPPGVRRLLEGVRARLAAGREEAAEPCDLSRVWREGAGQLPCTLLVRDKLFTTGLVAVPPDVELAGLDLSATLYKAAEYGERPTAWEGPLALLVDRKTGSAAELFAALLRDNSAATVIGERTSGTGCGYTNGGIQAVLEHSRLEVWLPDCVRHRRGGGNERAGIAADLPLGWPRRETAEEPGISFAARIAIWAADPDAALAPPPETEP